MSNNSSHHHKIMLNDYKKRLLISIILTIPILIFSPLIQNIFNININLKFDKYILWIFSIIILIIGGYPFIKGFIKEIKHKSIGMMTLISLAIFTSFIYSSAVVFGLEGKYFFWELATLIDIMLLGHYIEMKSIISAKNAIEKLAQLLPHKAHLKINNKIKDINISELKTNDHVIIKVGEKIPADGIIIKGKSYINESIITGESRPIRKSNGDKIFAGSINTNSVLEMKVQNTKEKSYLHQIINLVKNAQKSQSNTQKFADKIAGILTLIAIIVGIFTFIYWLFYQDNIVFALERMVTVMVITCPHALGLAIPLVISRSTTIAAENGLFIKKYKAFEKFKNINIMVFDKTGTLTKGNFEVSTIKILDNKYNKKELIKIASSLEKQSEHPIAKAIIKKSNQLNIKNFYIVNNFKVLKGNGIKGIINKKQFYIVSEKYIKNNNINYKNYKLNNATTDIFIVQNNKLIGIISLSDTIRKTSKKTITKLKEQNIKTIVISGDNKKVVKSVSKKLKIDKYFAEVLPDKKQKIIKTLQKDTNIVAMVGDGVNDAPALAQADIGIAIGSGTDIAANTADILLINNKPIDVLKILHFGKKTYNKMLQNLFWAQIYNIFAIPLAAGILYEQGIIISPALGAFFMSLSTIIVAINAKLLKFK